MVDPTTAIDDDVPCMAVVDPSALLREAVSRFETQVRDVAIAMATSIVRDELARRRRTADPAPRSRSPAARRSQHAPTEIATTPAAASLVDLSATGRGGRTKWTRETAIDELAKLLASGTEIDAVFVSRYGPRGLVTAARKIFGRFDAALNVAGLQVARMYPEGSPQSRARSSQNK